jgi:hypothetical protein
MPEPESLGVSVTVTGWFCQPAGALSVVTGGVGVARGEAAVAVAKQHRDAVGTLVEDRQVEPAVAEIAADHLPR